MGGTYSNTYPPKFFYHARKRKITMMTEKKIDYMQYSIPFGNEPVCNVKIPAIRNYKTGLLNPETGERVFYGNVKSDKPLVILSGDACNELLLDMRQTEYVGNQLEKGATFSRIDLACDQYIDGDGLIVHEDYIQFFNENKIVSKFVQQNERSKHENKLKLIGEVNSEGIELQTLYFGNMKNRAKAGIVRVYDKGIDLGSYANAIIRLEIENKRKSAQGIARSIANGESVASLIKNKFNVLDDRWQAMIDAPDIEITRGKEKEKISEDIEALNRKAWLIDCAKVLGKVLARDFMQQKNDFYQSFNDAVEKAYIAELSEIEKRAKE